MQFRIEGQVLTVRRDGETLRIEPWGEDALRVRAYRNRPLRENVGALTEEPYPDPARPAQAQIRLYDALDPIEPEAGKKPYAEIINGRIRAVVNFAGVVTYYRDDQVILQEYYRFYGGTVKPYSRCLKRTNREWKGIIGGSEYRLTVRFDSNPGEKIFGMGQYQQNEMNLKGCHLELAQRNSQVSIPFMVSSLGYGFLWNIPAVGSAVFGENYTEWKAESTQQMDYWIAAGEDPKDLVEKYTAVSGRSPLFPEDRMGLWQCKLRYRTQEEVLEVARRYRDEGIPLDMIVIDFFHWTVQGEWRFDAEYWPDPKAMIDELHAMGTKVCISVWPSVDRRSRYYDLMMDRGLLIRTERGEAETYDYQGDCVSVDAFSPEAREFVWAKCKESYYAMGMDSFWLDNCEPDFGVYDFDQFRYCIGPAMSCSNQYPLQFSRAFYEPMHRESKEPFVNLIRCGWAGSQKYANVIWSGDIPSTFESLQQQLAAGLNMGLAGIAWWTTDIGGFMTNDVSDPDFRQLLIRWYQFAVYSAVLRMHGDRGPYNIPALDDRDWGGGYLHTGQPNELWSYGETNFEIMKNYLRIRLEMHDYIRDLYQEAHENGSPLIRAMFYEFPQDPHCWELKDQYMFGPDYLVAPILHLNRFEREVYLPEGIWKKVSHTPGQEEEVLYRGGQTIRVLAPLEEIPVFYRVKE